MNRVITPRTVGLGNGSEQEQGAVESLFLGDGFLLDIEVLAGHPFLAHRKGTAAVQLLGSLFRSGFAREHVVGLGAGGAGCQGNACREEQSQSDGIHGLPEDEK